MTIVFPFGGVAFHEAGCVSAFLSATETVRKQAAQLILVCLFILFGPMSVVTTPSLVLLLVFVSWSGLTFCERVLLAFRCEPVRHMQPACVFGTVRNG